MNKLDRIRYLYKRQRGKCWYCGRLCRETITGIDIQYPNTATLEHQGKIRKTVMACYECNHAKGKWSDILNRELRWKN